MTNNDMIEIDGSMGEGGGQVVRSAIALSAITARPVRIVHIRHGRPNPGLRPQHLTAVRYAAAISDAKVKGDTIGSEELEFFPGKVRDGRFKIDIGTAGSIALLLQCLLPIAVHHGGEFVFRVRGGTDVPHSPPMDYFTHVFLNNLVRCGVNMEWDVLRRGYYPRGGGEVEVRCHGGNFRWPYASLDDIESQPFTSLWARIFISNLPDHIPKRIKHTVIKYSTQRMGRLGLRSEVHVERCEALDPGVGLCAGLTSATGIEVGVASLGRKGLPSEKLARNVMDTVWSIAEGRYNVDINGCDQYSIYLALFGGGLMYAPSLSNHARTQLDLIKTFLDVGIEARPYMAVYGVKGGEIIRIGPQIP